MADQMTPAEIIRRLHGVINTALSDSFTVEEDRAVGRAESEACEAERREAEAVRDEVFAAIRRLADVIEYTERIAGSNRAESPFAVEQVRHHDALSILRIARGETNEREGNEHSG